MQCAQAADEAAAERATQMKQDALAMAEEEAAVKLASIEVEVQRKTQQELELKAAMDTAVEMLWPTAEKDASGLLSAKVAASLLSLSGMSRVKLRTVELTSKKSQPGRTVEWIEDRTAIDFGEISFSG